MSLYDMLTPEEAAYHDALVRIAQEYGPFDKGSGSIWVGYEPGEENEKAAMGVKCSNCTMHYMTQDGKMGCQILSYLVEPEGYCRLAAIPDGLVDPSKGEREMEEEHAEEMMEDMDKKAPCWDGYVMRGMKPADDGSGRMVPNCVPAKKESFWGGNFDNRSFSKYNGCCPE